MNWRQLGQSWVLQTKLPGGYTLFVAQVDYCDWWKLSARCYGAYVEPPTDDLMHTAEAAMAYGSNWLAGMLDRERAALGDAPASPVLRLADNTIPLFGQLSEVK